MLVNGTDYSVFRRDRVGKVGGGVLVLVKNSLKCVQVQVPQRLSSLECIVFDIIGTGSTKLRCVCMYRTPEPLLKSEQEQARTSLLADLVSFACTAEYPSVLVGDVNFPYIDWKSFSTVGGDRNHEIFLDACLSNGLSQFVDFPTHACGNILDVVLCNDDSLVLDVSEDEPFAATCDHSAVKFVLNFCVKRNSKEPRSYRNFRKADYAAINKCLSEIKWTAIVSSATSVDALYSEICKIQIFIQPG